MTTTDAGHVPGTSIDERAEQLLGRRDDQGPVGIVLFEPVEQGYRCPVHQRTFAQESTELTLHWSEYQAFLWYALCDRDYPSALCTPDIDKAIQVFLDTVEQAVQHATPTDDR